MKAKFATRKTAAVKAAAQWKASDFPTLPVNAKAFAQNTMTTNNITERQLTPLERVAAYFKAQREGKAAPVQTDSTKIELTGLARTAAAFKAHNVSKN